MMKIAAYLFPTLLVLCLLSTCFYDSEEYLYPQFNNLCDTTSGITFDKSVKPILNFDCYGCHSNKTALKEGAGIKLEDYPDVKKKVTDGKLIGSITHSGCCSPMPWPLGASKLEDCKITIIQKWILSDAPDN